MKKTVLTYMLMLFAVAVWSQDEELPHFTTQGTEFLVTFGQAGGSVKPSELNELAGRAVLFIRVATTEVTTVKIEFADKTQQGMSKTIAANSIYNFSFEDLQKPSVYLPRPNNGNLSSAYTNASESNKKKSVTVKADHPISVYAGVSNGNDAGATNVLPIDVLGTDYYHISYNSYNSKSSEYKYARFDGYAVIATQDGTSIYENNSQTAKTKLNKGEVYYAYSAIGDDYTGKYIHASHPVAYYVINTGAKIPTSWSSSENLFQQMVPVNCWGREFVIPASNGKNNYVRIVASDKNTEIAVTNGAGNPLKYTLSSRGAYKELNLATLKLTEGCYISSNKPVGVCAYIGGMHYGAGADGYSIDGDPAMSVIPPLEQKIKSTTVSPFFFAPSQGVLSHYLLIVTSTESKGQTLFSERGGALKPLTGGSWQDIGSSGYSYYTLNKVSVDNVFTFENPDSLIVLGYGYGGSVGYYYLAGAAARSINPHFTVNGVHHQDAIGTEFCPGEEVHIVSSITSRFPGSKPYEKASLTWYLDDALMGGNTDVEDWYWDSKAKKAGTYKISMWVKNIFGQIDSCITYLVIKDCYVPNYWIGGGGNGIKEQDPNPQTMNLWSRPENWTANQLPGEGDTVKFHPDALDLHVDSLYKVVAIDATGAQKHQGVRVLKNSSLELTSSATPPLNLGKGQLYIEAGGPGGKNGTFITQPGASVTATVQMYSRAKNQDTKKNLYDADTLAWQYFGIPVSQAIPKTVFADAIVRQYREESDNYWGIVEGGNAMKPYLGYELAWLASDPRKGYFDFTGSLVNTGHTVSLNRTANVPFSGYYVVSNPYTAGLKIKDGLIFGPGMENTVYLFHTGSSEQWDDWASGVTGDGAGAGQYIAVPQALAGTGSLLPETVSSMQGFVVKLADESSSSTLGFNYKDVMQNTATLRSARPEPKAYTMITLKGDGRVDDWMWLFTEPQLTHGFDNGYDGRKMRKLTSLSQLYAVEEDGNYQVNSVPDVDNTCLAFKAEKGVRSYTLTFHHQDIRLFYPKIYLIDLVKDNQALIDVTEEGSTYSFTADNADQVAKRFRIVTKSNLTATEKTGENRLDIRCVNDEIVISNGDQPAHADIYNVTGRLLYRTALQPYQTKQIDKDLASGVYIVRVQLPGRCVTEKIIK